MKLLPRHIFLILGATLVLISFLFFVSAHSKYTILLAAGLIIASSALLVIWLKDKPRIKFLWTTIAVLFGIIQQLTENSSIKQSSKWMIQNNEKILINVSLNLISKPTDILILKSSNLDTSVLFSDKERQSISKLFQDTDIKLIMKDSTKIYYEVYGMLDTRISFSCSYNKSPTDYGTGMNTYILKWNY